MTRGLDTESTYGSGRDIRSLGVKRYVCHPETDHYMVGLYDEGFAWVGAPKDAPWHMLKDATLVSHHAAYDQAVIEELRRRGLAIPAPAGWHCSADLSAYRQSPRALADAARELLGVQLDKSIRGRMKGREWADLDPFEKEDVARYGLCDAKASYLLWEQNACDWPEQEMALSEHTATMTRRGVALDMEKVEVGITRLQTERMKAEDEIPWAGSLDEHGKELPITSPALIARECRRLNIEPPATTDSKSVEWEVWEERNGISAPFVAAIQKWRRTNRLLGVLLAMRTRQVDGVLSYGLKYFGAAHTGRWSGDLGLNLQNLPRKPFLGVDARACLVPRPGKRFITADLAQIEARVALWLAGDTAMLEMLRGGMDLYEAHARRTMGYADPRPLREANNDLRQFAKCRVLGLGFGLGGPKFQTIVKQWTGQDISGERAGDVVADFRRKNPGIIKTWRSLEAGLKQSRGGEFTSELPNGRMIRYFDVAEIEHRWSGRVERGQPRKILYGGLLFENVVQATARDLFANAVLRLEATGLPVVLHVHDEAVMEVDQADAEDAVHEAGIIMRNVPEWATGLPVEAEVNIRENYGK